MKILKNEGYGEPRLVVLGERGPEDIIVPSPGGTAIIELGDVVSAKIRAYNPLLRGYFAETAQGDVFIPTSAPFSEGQAVSVKITKEARADKDATGCLVVCSENVPELEGEPVSNAEMDEMIDEALSPDVVLADGGELHIERTKVCWTIDVDSGKSTDALKDVNKKACSEIARQIRLKNMGGLILVDFAGSKRIQKQLEKELVEALADDVLVQVKGWTRAGLLEIERGRARADLWQTCGAQNPTAVYYRVRRAVGDLKTAHPTVFVAPEVLRLLQQSDIRAKVEPVFDKPISYFEIKEK